MRLIQYRNPFEEEVEHLNRIFNWAFPALNRGEFRGTVRPAVDFYENEEGYRLEVDLPGYTREQIELDHQDGTLTLKAEQVESATDKENRRVVERTITLPEDVAADKIQARLNNGVLEVTLPRREDLKPARIEVR